MKLKINYPVTLPKIFIGIFCSILIISQITNYAGYSNFSLNNFRIILLGASYPWLIISLMFTFIAFFIFHQIPKTKYSSFLSFIFGIFGFVFFLIGAWYLIGVFDTPTTYKGKCTLLSKSATNSNGFIGINGKWYRNINFSYKNWLNLSKNRKELSRIDTKCPCAYEVDTIVLPHMKIVLDAKYDFSKPQTNLKCTLP